MKKSKIIKASIAVLLSILLSGCFLFEVGSRINIEELFLSINNKFFTMVWDIDSDNLEKYDADTIKLKINGIPVEYSLSEYTNCGDICLSMPASIMNYEFFPPDSGYHDYSQEYTILFYIEGTTDDDSNNFSFTVYPDVEEIKLIESETNNHDYTYEYDSSGKIITIEQDGDTLYTFEYNDKDQLIRKDRYGFGSYFIFYYYDSEGKLINEDYYCSDFYIDTEYIYSGDLLIQTIEEADYIIGLNTDPRTITDYYNDGNIKEERIYKKDSGSYPPDPDEHYSYTYAFNEHDDCVSENKYDVINSQTVSDFSYSYEYDIGGKMRKKFLTDNIENVVTREEYVYGFLGYLILEIHYDENNEKTFSEYFEYEDTKYEYDI